MHGLHSTSFKGFACLSTGIIAISILHPAVQLRISTAAFDFFGCALTDKFGTGFSIVRGDIGGNIDRLAAARTKDARYTTLFAIITDEVKRGEQEGGQSDTNALLWLKR